MSPSTPQVKHCAILEPVFSATRLILALLNLEKDANAGSDDRQRVTYWYSVLSHLISVVLLIQEVGPPVQRLN